jgi:DNA/RNA endonuclease YhcR with UshA esterase domain
MNIKHFSLVFSVAGISILYFLSTLSQPILIDLHEIPNYEDKRVVVEGIVTEAYTTSYGSQILTITDDTGTVTVFLDEPTEINYGDKIQATGEVQKYKGEWEIIVDNARYVTIIQQWQNSTIPIEQLAQNPIKYDGLNINVTGYIDTVYDTYFYLVDSENTYSLPVFFKSSMTKRLFPGQKASVAALFTYDEDTFRFSLECKEEKHTISLLR